MSTFEESSPYVDHDVTVTSQTHSIGISHANEESRSGFKNYFDTIFKSDSIFVIGIIIIIIIIGSVVVFVVVTYFHKPSSGFLNSSNRSDSQMDESFLTKQINTLNKMQKQNMHTMKY